jgi:hypothetical protein
MRVDARLLRAGVFLILLGVPPLLVQTGAVDAEAFNGAWHLWPLVLIAIGLGMLLRMTAFAVLGGVLVAGTFGLLLGTVVATGGSFVGACVGSPTTPDLQLTHEGQFAGESASVRLSLDCGDVDISTQAGDGWTVRTLAGQAQPTVAQTDTRLEVRSAGGVRSFFDLGRSDRRDHWQVVLPTGPRIDLALELNAAAGRVDLGGARVGSLSLEVNAGSSTVDLSGATVDRVDADVNAGDLRLTLGPGADLPVNVGVNAGSFELCLPPGVALQVDLNETLSNHNLAARGLIRNGRQWRTPDFDTAASRVRLQLTPNAASMNLDPDGGCR